MAIISIADGALSKIMNVEVSQDIRHMLVFNRPQTLV